METSVTAIIEKLDSDELERQLSGLDDARALISQFARRSVELLLSSSSPYVIAEKLFAMGPSVIGDLEKQLDGDDAQPEARTYAALVLLKLGSRKGVSQLFRSLKDGVGPIGMIAESLGLAQVPGAGEAISDALKDGALSKEPYTVVTLVCALRRLGATVPDEVLRQLDESAPQLRKLV